MDVRLSNLLNSAEKLVREKSPQRNESKSAQEGQTPPPIPQADRAEFSHALAGKFHTIQNKLSELQNQLSREQMRAALLKEKDPKADELIHVLFGKDPLFPELQGQKETGGTPPTGAPDLNQLLVQSEERVQSIEKELRAKEVENENVVSLGVGLGVPEISKALTGIEQIAWKPMNEKSVQRLIEP
jgi:hypothetical protein